MADCILIGSGGGGVLSEDVTASKANVLAGTKTITTDSNDEVVDGTMVNRGAVNQILGINGTYTIPQGYHDGTGKVTQSIPVQGAKTITPNGDTQTVPSGRYLNGNITVPGFSLPDASIIKRGATVTIYGRSVTGTWEGYVQNATIPYNRGTFASGYSIAGQQSCVNYPGANSKIAYNPTNIRLTGGTTYHSRYCGVLYFAKRSLVGINTINMSYLTNMPVGTDATERAFIAVQPELYETFNFSNTTVYMTGTTNSATVEQTITLHVGTLTTSQYILFGFARYQTNATYYFDITKIWYT